MIFAGGLGAWSLWRTSATTVGLCPARALARSTAGSLHAAVPAIKSADASSATRPMNIPLALPLPLPEIPVDIDHRELHRVGGGVVRRLEARLALFPDLADLYRQLGAELHLPRDDLRPASGRAEALVQLRFHRLAIGGGRVVEMADRLEHPGVDKAQEGLVGVAVTQIVFSIIHSSRNKP